VLPLEFVEGDSVESLHLTGREIYRIGGLPALAEAGPLPRELTVSAGGREFAVRARIDTPFECQVFLAGGILPFTLRRLATGDKE